MKRIVFSFLYCFFLAGFQSCAQTTGGISPGIDGNWLLTINSESTGQIRVNMELHTHQKEKDNVVLLDAASTPNMDRKIFGFWKAELARLLGKLRKKGSLIMIENGKLTAGDSLTGTLITPFGSYNFRALVKKDTLEGIFKNKKQEIMGSISGIKKPKATLENYPALMDSVILLTQQRIYDPKQLQDKSWRQFTSKMNRLCRFTSDDAAFLLGFYYYSHKYLPFSHFYLFRSFNEEQQEQGANKASKFVYLERKSKETAYMKITSFSGVSAEMDSAFREITTTGYKNLIVDLRDNSGGSIAAGMTFVQHLLSDTLLGGVFLTQKYFRDHTQPPAPVQYAQFPHLSKANYALLIKGIYQYPGICLIAAPRQPVFKGKVYILTNSLTASTCEPIVYGLKQNHRALIIGTKTAGAMLTGEQFPVGNGYTLTIPTATYYTADGFKIDQKGVQPDITPEKEDALDYTLQRIKSASAHE